VTTTPADSMRTMLQRALGRIEALERELAGVRAERREPIAIVGAACRLPGGANTRADLWRLLDAGADVVTEISADRWTLPPARRGDGPQARSGRWAGQIDRPDGFDAAFFGVSPREALTMDPQHRLLLEVAWEALEDAGLVAADLLGSRAGVFVGATSADYARRVAAAPALHDAYAFTGNQLCVAAGRVAYTFGLQGPCMIVDTACSSSLVAVHQAVQSLRAGESTLALVGGVNLVLDPEHMELATKISALSPGGRCKTFDAAADGFARGEGCVLLVLKRLADALRDGDPVRAVIHGSAVNQDGRSTGLTAPNVLAQEELLRAALRDAGMTAGQVDYIEAHGTGTPLGDPIELDALLAVFGAPRPDGTRCAVGSVKTNLGHTEAAAGATGLLKVLTSLEHAEIPRHVGFETLNPRVTLAGTALTIPTAPIPWPAGARRRCAGVSSFGLSGTNAHVLVGDPPAAPDLPARPARGAELLVLSARDPAALRALAGRWVALLRGERPAPLPVLAAAAALRRARFEHRLALAGDAHDVLAERLEGWLAGRDEAASGLAAPGLRPVFVFPGQGSQWSGMGRSLYRDEPAFRAAVDACAAAFAPHVDWSLVEVLHADRPDALARIDVVQPTLFAMGYALAALWRSWGVEPAAVVGHSMGEVAAAAVAGILTLDDAARVICLRSRLLRRVAGQGAMLLVELSPADAERELAGHADRVSVAVNNSPQSTVLSGATDALDEIHARLTARGVFARRVNVDVASHSPQMDPLTADLLAALAPVRPQAGGVDLCSTVDLSLGARPTMDAPYWVKNLRAPVRFADAVAALHARGHALFLECSPHPVLVPAIEATLRARGVDGAALPSLRRDHDERAALLDALARAHVRGVDPAWRVLFPGPVAAAALPTYPFQREPYWLPHVDADARPAARAADGLPLLPARTPSSLDPGAVFHDGRLRADHPAWLADHRVGDAVVLPAAALLVAALDAARAAPTAGSPADTVPFALTGVALHDALVIPADAARRAQLALAPFAGATRFRLSSLADGAAAFVLHAGGEVVPAAPIAAAPLADLRARLADAARRDVDAYYAELARRGLHFGPAFRGLRELRVAGAEVLARVAATDAVAADPADHLVHPALLDAALQPLLATALAAPETGYVPVAVGRVQLAPVPAGTALWSHLKLRSAPPEAPELPPSLLADVTIYSDDGAVLGALADLRLRPLERRAAARPSPLWAVAWREAPRPAPALAPTRWLVLAAGPRGDALADALAAAGHTVTRVAPGAATRELAPGRWEVDLRRPGALVDPVRAAFSATDANGALLHLLGLDADLPAAPDPAALTRLWQDGVEVALHAVQSLARTTWRNPPRLVLVTRGAVADDPTAPDAAAAPWQAPLHGFATALAYEHPELRCKRIDLPLAPTPAALDALLDELLADDREDAVTLRDAVTSDLSPGTSDRAPRTPSDLSSGTASPSAVLRRVARLEPRPHAPAEPPRLRGTWLITGGLGGLGLSLARWLGERGAERVVLAGRTLALDPAREAALAAARATGAAVDLAALDVADRPAVDALLAALDADGPPLRGLVHAAVVLRDGLAVQQDLARFREVMAPKILGAWNLHAAAEGRALDHFILYGSAAAALGSPGQSNYMAAGAFLPVLAEHRRRRGLPALCVDWGAFTEVGAAVASADRGERLQHRGLQGMTPAEGEALLGDLLAAPPARAVVLRLDPRQWLEFYPPVAHQPYFAGLRELAGRQETAAGEAALRAGLDALPPDQRPRRLEQHVREQVAAVLRMPPGRIERDAPLKSYGIDSLMGLEMRNRLEQTLGLRLSATLVWSYPTLAALAVHLGEQLWPPAPPTPEADPDRDRAAELAALTEDDKAALLAAKLAALEDLL
jgi:myxalamid-type polyketide synthase MxaE and MxaD